MRPLFAIMIWVVLVGGLSLYMHGRERSNPAGSYEIREAEGDFTLEVTTTFDVEPDPFALQTDAQDSQPALLVRFNGKDVLRRTERVEKGVPLRVEPVPGMIQGQNEIYIEANPSLEQAYRSMAVRIKVLRGVRVVADQSLWSEAGSRIATAFSLEIAVEKPPEERPHGH